MNIKIWISEALLTLGSVFFNILTISSCSSSLVGCVGPSSYLYRHFAQDSVILPIRLTHTEHLHILGPVHLEGQLLVGRKTVEVNTDRDKALKATTTGACTSYFKPFDPG